jgi:hypothetical protein
MADVFISYKREDRPLVRPLVRALQEIGFTVWWDSRIETGENWMACIKRALDAAGCVVVLWTPQSVARDSTYRSEIVGAEADEGRRRNVLLPVRMQNGPRGWPHGNRNEDDLSDWQGNNDDPTFQHLAGRIATLCGERKTPEPSELAAWLRAEEENNANAYRHFAREFPDSRFAKEAEPRIAEIAERLADTGLAVVAAVRIVEQFANEVSKPAFTPALEFAKIVRDRALSTTREELFNHLRQGLKAVLQAEPGAGKTTTLLEWAREYSSSDLERVGVYVRLKEIANAGDDLLAHVERLDATGLVSEGAWNALARSGMLALFCDGWNELSDAERASIGTKLDIYARSFPESALVVGSRPLAPAPLQGKHLLLTLQKLTGEQVRAITEDRLAAGASAALNELGASQQLRDLVRTPFFLSAFCQTRSAGTTPVTREGLIRGMLIASEQLPQHDGPLKKALGGQHPKYLRALSVEMLQKQQGELGNDDARRTVNRESKALKESELWNTTPDAGIVLETLRDHHCLIEHSGFNPSFRFQHQLISEWYASDEVFRIAVLALRDNEARRSLDRNIIDRFEWTEAVLFAVERPQDCAEGVSALSHLILRTIGINPRFAADLIADAPDEVWQVIAPTVRAFVEEWQATAKHRALQFVLQCGKEEFSEIVWAAITNDPTGDVPNALHASEFPRPSILGGNWRAKCAALSAQGRERLLDMLASSRGLEGATMALAAAIDDEEAKVQTSVAEMLDFHGFREELETLLRAAHAETWEELVRIRHIESIWEEPWRGNAIAAAHRLFVRTAPGSQRLDHALFLQSLGEKVEIDFVSEITGIKFEDYHAEEQLYARIAEFDGDRLSDVLIERLLTGQKVPYRASQYIRRGTRVSQERLLNASRAKGQYRYHDMLSPLLDVDSLATLLKEIIAVQDELHAANGKERSAIGERYHALQDALTHADKNRLAESILDWTTANSSQIGVVADVMMRTYRNTERDDERAPLRSDLRAELVSHLIEWSSRAVDDPASSRYALHSIAEAMAVFPSTSLLAPLRSLLAADLKLWRGQKDEFKARIARGQSPDPSSGARMSYAFRYGQNMLSLAIGRDADVGDSGAERSPVSREMTEAVIDLLREFLTDHEFGAEAARVIATLRPDPILEVGKAREHMSYDLRVVPARRAFRAKEGSTSVDPVARQIVQVIQDQPIDDSREALGHALELANAAVRMGCGEYLASITAMVVERTPLEAISKHMMLRLLFGHAVDGQVAEQCLNDLDARRTTRQWEYGQNWFQWQELLIQMIFGGKPLEAAQRLLTYDHRTQNHDEQRIVEALGLCGHPQALAALDLLRDRCTEQRITHAWCSAINAIGSSEAGERLLALIVDASQERDWHQERQISEMVAELAERHVSLWDRIFEIIREGNPVNLKRVARVVSHVRQDKLLADLIGMPGDSLQVLGGAIADALRELCVERRPIEGSNGVFDMVPRPIQQLRAALFRRASGNDSGSAVCARLLHTIEDAREHYGEPPEEARHPDIAIEQPWPLVARGAWDAATRLRDGASRQ